MSVSRFACLLLGLCFSSVTVTADPITTGTLVEEMIDLKGLCELPRPFFHTVQFSSYDRRSQSPGAPGWFENSDGFGGEPLPGFEAVITRPNADGVGEYLVCDVKGPGAIVRVWTPAIIGRMRMYLDGAEQPVFDDTAEKFLRFTYQGLGTPKVDEKLLAGTFAQNLAGYYPIPFAKRCRIVWIGKLQEVHFYQVQIRLYEPGAEVVTFRPDDLKTYAEQIRKVAKVLADPDQHYPYASRQQLKMIEASLAPAEKKEVLKLDGPGAMEQLVLKVSAADLDRALRQTILYVSCDDYPWGQVQSPIGDFFGAAPGINPQNALPFTIRPDGTMICRYVMPFARSLQIVLDNRGTQPVKVTGSALPADHRWNDERSLHFRARWRVDHDLVGSGSAVQDLPLLIANGAGVYVGTTAMLLNPAPVPTPNGNWWGEGDEKIFVDGDVRPSTFGTGSEDYFNYGWSRPDIFVHAYCGQPRNDGPANRGFVTNNRWHILDCLPFKQRLSFYMELFCHETVPGMSYARIGYHYGRPGIMDDHVNITNEDVRPLELPPDWQPAARRGASNSVFYQAEDLLLKGEQSGISFQKNNLWSGGRLLVWRPGEELAFKFPIEQAGKYTVHITAAQTPESGKVAVLVDGKPAGFGGQKGILDLAVPHRTLSRVFSSGALELGRGDHALTLRYEGEEGRTVGVDFIWVQKR